MNDKKLTIGEFNDSFMPVMDGVVSVVKNNTVELNKLGHKAYAVVSGYKDYPDYDKENGIDYTIMGDGYYVIKSLQPYGVTTFSKEKRDMIYNLPFDIVHANCPTIIGRIALKTSRLRNIPLVSTFHTFIRDDLNIMFPEHC